MATTLQSRTSTAEPSAARPLDYAGLAERHARMQAEIGAIVIGQERACEHAFVALLCAGHVLFQGVPGVAKTLLVRSLASALSVRFGRVQFTADLMPSDILGSPVFHASDHTFRFRPGPIFTDLLLADEINRAPAKTQAAMLEAMQERVVTVDGTHHELGSFFTVFATQNPIEQEGTYPLPEAELDRFLFRIDVGYPAEADELRMLGAHHACDPVLSAANAAFTAAELELARGLVQRVQVKDEILTYALRLVRSTRDDPALAVGGSPRAALALVRAAKAVAALAGRDFVLPDDVQEVWHPVFRHRVVLEPAAEVDGMRSDDALDQVLKRVPVPH